MQSSAITSWFFRIIISVENIAESVFFFVNCNSFLQDFQYVENGKQLSKKSILFEVGVLHNTIKVSTATFI